MNYKFTISVTQGQALPPSGGTLCLFCRQKEPRGTSGTQMVTICYTFAMLSEHQVELRRSSHETLPAFCYVYCPVSQTQLTLKRLKRRPRSQS